jgi:hypothetical protein
MLFSTLSIALSLLSSLTLTPTSASPLALPGPLTQRYLPQGTIDTPANGTALTPGAPFAFHYNPRSDYCVYSHNFSVWLMSAPPATAFETLLAGANGLDGDGSANVVEGPSGTYFGRYSYDSYSEFFFEFGSGMWD